MYVTLNLRNGKMALFSVPVNLYGFLKVTVVMLINSRKPSWAWKFSSSTIVREYTEMACNRIGYVCLVCTRR